MRPSLTAAALALMLSAGPALAQQNVAPSRLDADPGAPYAVGTFGDWQVRCIRADDPANDPCQMTQELRSADGSPTAEVSVFPVPNNPRGPAAMTVVTPLETLLQRGVNFTIDSGGEGAMPFQFCNQQGCIAQQPVSAEAIDAFKGGATATVTLFAARAPEQPVRLEMSLDGFTAAYDSMAPLPGLE